MNTIKGSLIFQNNENDVGVMIKKATHFEKYDVEWQDFITICKEINYTANASKKALMVIQKQLKEYKEPQTQFLTLSLLKEITANCQVFEKEYREKGFIDSLSNMWNSPVLNSKVRTMFKLCIQMWLIKYKDDLYLHNLIQFCKSTVNEYGQYIIRGDRDNNSGHFWSGFGGAADMLRPSQSYTTYTIQQQPYYSPPPHHQPQYNPYNTYTSNNSYNNNTYYPPSPSSPSRAVVQQQQSHNHLQHFYASSSSSNYTNNGKQVLQQQQKNNENEEDNDDDTTRLTNQHFLFAPSAEAANHGAVVRYNNSNRAYDAILRTSSSSPITTSKAGERARSYADIANPNNRSLSRFEMDALIEEASTTAQLLNEILLNGPVVQDDVLLDELYNQCRGQHGRIIRQIWSLGQNDLVYQETLTDKAREIYLVINKYKKTFNDKGMNMKIMNNSHIS